MRERSPVASVQTLVQAIHDVFRKRWSFVDEAAVNLDEGSAGGKGSAEQGFSGDDGGHVPGAGKGVPASRNPGAAADLGANPWLTLKFTNLLE